MADPKLNGYQIETDETPAAFLFPGVPTLSGLQLGTDETPAQFLFPNLPLLVGIQIQLGRVGQKNKTFTAGFKHFNEERGVKRGHPGFFR